MFGIFFAFGIPRIRKQNAQVDESDQCYVAGLEAESGADGKVVAAMDMHEPDETENKAVGDMDKQARS